MATSAQCDPYLHVSTCKDGTSAGLKCNGFGGDEAARCYAQCYGCLLYTSHTVNSVNF